MIYLVVTMDIKEGKMDEFLAACQRIRPQVLAEQGCLMYDFTRDISIGSPVQEPATDNRVTLLEKWASREDLDQHSVSNHMREFVAQVASMRERVVIRSTTEAF